MAKYSPNSHEIAPVTFRPFIYDVETVRQLFRTHIVRWATECYVNDFRALPSLFDTLVREVQSNPDFASICPDLNSSLRQKKLRQTVIEIIVDVSPDLVTVFGEHNLVDNLG